jgi:glycosyltransferase involved in cell wall biosynthesis
MFAKGYKICKCGNEMPLHTKICDLNGCPETDIIKIVDNKKDDVLLYLHMMRNEYSMGPGRTNSLESHLINAGFKDDDYEKLFSFNTKEIYNGEVSEQDLNEIYNASNLNSSTSQGEGCGLSLLEASATGTPSIAPRNSAIPEQLRGTGILVPNIATYSFPNDNAHIRPIVDACKFRDALQVYYDEWKQSKVNKVVHQECIDNINQNFLWDDKRALLTKLLKDTIA